MKLLLKLLLVLPLLAVALPFLIKGPSGRPLLSFDSFQAPRTIVPELPEIKGVLEKARDSLADLAPEKPAKATRVYKWRDANGTLSFSDRPNPNGSSEQVLVNSNVNILPSSPAKMGNQQNAENEGVVSCLHMENLQLPSPTSIPLKQIPQLIKDAKAVSELAGQQKQIRQRLLE